MEMMGWKYNMDDIQAALLINQIDRLDENRHRRQHIEELYRELLRNIDGLDFIEASGENEKSAHTVYVLLPRPCDRDEVLSRLQEQGIGCASITGQFTPLRISVKHLIMSRKIIPWLMKSAIGHSLCLYPGGGPTRMSLMFPRHCRERWN
jgi:dTDP-4-amino-4,6-dideoxygalactose transaminase